MKITNILQELYTPDVTYLNKYLSKEVDDIDPYYVWGSNSYVEPSIIEWLDDNYPDILSKLMQKYDEDDPDEIEPDAWWDIPEKIRNEYENLVGEDYINSLMRIDPSSAPSTAFFSRAQLVKRQTWLIHFSDNAYDIASEGFKYGVDQMDRLGLTNYLGDAEKAYKGYNFAVEAGSRDAKTIAREGKYGDNAVMFTNAGVKAWHSGDEEEQVIFWGDNVDPRDIILIENDYGNWCVKPHPTKNYDRECVYQNEDFTTVTNWIEKNWRQYSRIITGR